jgi:hypothetical protein
MPQTPLLDLADVELAQLIATAALLPFEQRAGFVQRVGLGGRCANAAGSSAVIPMDSANPTPRSRRRCRRPATPICWGA